MSGFLSPLFRCMLSVAAASSVLIDSAAAETPAGNYSRLVHPGPNGRLVYEPDERGNVIPDFSYAGYMNGGVELPVVKVKAAVQPGGEGDAERIQAAIDRVSALPPDKDGFRGAVLLKRGRYELDTPIHIAAGGVILRGEGADEDGTVLFAQGVISGKTFRDMRDGANLIEVRGTSGFDELRDTAVRITDEYVPSGARSFRVESAANFHPGDTVIVRRYGNREWFKALRIDAERLRGRTSHDFERTITGILGDRITVNIPLVCAIEARWSEGELVKYTDTGRITQIGVENLRGISDYDPNIRTNRYDGMDRSEYFGAEYSSDENHCWNFIRMSDVENAWVRNVAALHFAGCAVFLESGCTQITVRDCIALEPVSYCAYGRRLSFQVCGQLCLVQQCRSDRGRNAFAIGGLATCGPNVFLDCTATRPYGVSEPHTTLAAGVLYDNVQSPLAFRFNASTLPRWMGLHNVMW
ncbi:MAG: hypothetical protein ACYC9O_12235, partial [Candidatus Latescibacterota bacterium]